MAKKGECMISFIVPVYNGQAYIADCIESIIKQKYDDFELIIVDDGSTDQTLEICKRYTNGRIRIITQKNSGVSAARNTGVSAAKGDYIVFVDVDDIVTENYVELIEKYSEDSPDLIVFSRNIPENMVQKDMNEIRKMVLLISDRINNAIKLNAVWSKAYKKKFIQDNQIMFREGVVHGEDMLFNLNIIEKTPYIKYVREAVYYLRKSEESAIHRYQQNFYKTDISFLQEVIAIMRDSENGQEMMEYYNRIAANGLYLSLSQSLFHKENGMSRQELIKNCNYIYHHEVYREVIKNILKNNISLSKSRGMVLKQFAKKRYLLARRLMIILNYIITKKRIKETNYKELQEI